MTKKYVLNFSVQNRTMDLVNNITKSFYSHINAIEDIRHKITLSNERGNATELKTNIIKDCDLTSKTLNDLNNDFVNIQNTMNISKNECKSELKKDSSHNCLSSIFKGIQKIDETHNQLSTLVKYIASKQGHSASSLDQASSNYQDDFDGYVAMLDILTKMSSHDNALVKDAQDMYGSVTKAIKHMNYGLDDTSTATGDHTDHE